VEVGGGRNEMPKFIPLGDRSIQIKTVMHATKELFNAWQVHDYFTVMRFIDRHSQFLINTLLPDNGYYKGQHGFARMISSWFRTAAVKNETYRINFVDEARQICVVTCSSSGVFRNNGVNFENVKEVIFIKWDMGKISKMNMVELNPEKTYSLFLSKAQKQFNKLLEGLYLGGNNIRQVIDRCVADDVTFSFNNIYPVSLLVEDASNATKYQGKDCIATLKGKDNVMKLAVLGDKLLFNLTSKIKVLYSDENTVVAAKNFETNNRSFPCFREKLLASSDHSVLH